MASFKSPNVAVENLQTPQPNLQQQNERPTTSNLIKLQCKEGKVFSVPEKVARMSQLISNLHESLHNCSNSEDAFNSEPIPLNNIPEGILTLVLSWAEYHQNDSVSKTINPENEEVVVDEEERERKSPISQWDQDFLKVLDQSTLFELITAANYLDMKELLYVSAKTVGNMLLRCGSPEMIRQTFNIEYEFGPGEEEQIRMENAWFAK